MMNLLPGIQPTAQALDAEKLRMDLIAQNMANAQTTRGPDGEVYQRKMAVFESVLDRQAGGLDAKDQYGQGVRITRVVTDDTPGERIYNPAHPHADAQGMVEMPNIKPAQEMVDLISSSRAYQANLSVIRSAREMARQALAISS